MTRASCCTLSGMISMCAFDSASNSARSSVGHRGSTVTSNRIGVSSSAPPSLLPAVLELSNASLLA
eukprot:CAMPEP_0185839794 /NCGR_PEP_ID=MMETSP1353-20130828/15201_1 /TAXON_ID=1077150 /ORGANISM="Erythrolobus australicus, Strain CCMP3124" /LENGTH=65 /DNA_ID=CAMNT_0028539011 /DNA_START=9 /DNA_END=203 /DNA_ORIENTATION=+